MKYRIGIGYDIHRLVKNRKFILGGVKIPFAKGLAGHSDADVLLHAISDALLGAAGEPDIGELFPDTQMCLKGISSLRLLEKIYQRITRKKIKIINIDSVIVIEEPKIAAYKHSMRRNIADVLDIGIGCVNVKAKTREGLGKKAVEAYAATLIKK